MRKEIEEYFPFSFVINYALLGRNDVNLGEL
jgi:hypothetical protein